jgi:hypothetical protein
MYVGVAAALSMLAATQARAEPVALFNGKDLTGWEASFGSFGPGNTPRRIDDVWTVQDGAIFCRGGARNGGWLHTAKSFANYELHLEFRWGKIDPAVLAAGGNIYNAGVFLRSNPGATPNGGRSMMAYQAQIIHTPARASGEAGGGTGDAWISGYENPSFTGERPVARTTGGAPRAAGDAAPRRPRFRAPPPGTFPSRMFRRSKFAEKPIGEWNSYDITVNGDKLTYRLNGEVVNEVSGAMAMSGKIGLECENTPIFFRNIRVNTID